MKAKRIHENDGERIELESPTDGTRLVLDPATGDYVAVADDPSESPDDPPKPPNPEPAPNDPPNLPDVHISEDDSWTTWKD